MRAISDRDILKICYLYYKEEKTQDEISKLWGLSRFKISRTLKEARRRGLVTITIHDPNMELVQAETELAKNSSLQQTIVVKINEFSGESMLDQVGKAAASYLRDILPNYRTLGVTWGNTVYHVVHHLEPVRVKDLVLVQIGGGLGTIEGMDNNTLTMTLGQKLGANAHVIPAPVIVRNREIRDTLFKEKKIQETLAIARKADLVLFGLGIIGPDGLLWKSGFLTKADAAKLKESGAVGAVCGRFFDSSGKQCWNELDDRTIGLNLDEFRRIKHKICVVTGKEKSDIIRAALKGKLLDVLITDDATAAGLLTEKKE